MYLNKMKTNFHGELQMRKMQDTVLLLRWKSTSKLFNEIALFYSPYRRNAYATKFDVQFWEENTINNEIFSY